MTDDLRQDPLMRRIAELPSVGGDGRRARYVRARCRAELEARRRKQTRSASVLHATVALLSAAYLVQVAWLALMLR